MKEKKLVQKAIDMRKRAIAPYSDYRVGAAVQTKNDEIIGGCNVESSSYGLTCCAERVAIYRAVAKGNTDINALAVATENGGSPCGACRQVIWDICGDIPVYISDEKGRIRETSSRELLPDAFDDAILLKP